jgi:hypothetical protein
MGLRRQLTPVVAHQLRLVKMGQMTATGHGHDAITEQGMGLAPEGGAQDTVLIAPEHADGLGWKR